MTNKRFNRQIGSEGEQIAAGYLIKKGYQILEQNFQTRFGEIDLVATRSASSGQAKLVFVEVKLKIGEDFGTPEEMISPAKISQVEKMANYYVLKNTGIAQKYPLFQIDAICLVFDEKKQLKRLNHYENINT
jgi:putative endonuclease